MARLVRVELLEVWCTTCGVLAPLQRGIEIRGDLALTEKLDALPPKKKRIRNLAKTQSSAAALSGLGVPLHRRGHHVVTHTIAIKWIACCAAVTKGIFLDRAEKLAGLDLKFL